MMRRNGHKFKPLLLFSFSSAFVGTIFNVSAAPAIPFPLQPRLVVAHFMVGNTYPYTYDDWSRDIILASTKGIDGFALNIGADPWEPARVADAFHIAYQLMKDTGPIDDATISYSPPDSSTVSNSSTKMSTSTSHITSPIPSTSSMSTHPIPSTITRASESAHTSTSAAGTCTRKHKRRMTRTSALSIPTSTAQVQSRSEGVPSWAYPYDNQHTNFTLFLSFDMTSLPCNSPNDTEQLRNYIRAYQTHPRYLRYEGRMLVSTFSGEHCTFGQGSVEQGWVKVLDFELRNKIHFVPSFFVNQGSELGGYRGFVDGDFHWNGAWPMGNYSIEPYPDYEHLRYNGGKTYMAGVSPWFFTHYGPNTYNKNWIYHFDDWLAVQRWELMVQNRAYIDIAQIISWNDYGESHYVGPVHGAQPMSQGWVDGFDHMPWLDMMHYYIDAYKTGNYPDITKDRIFLWGRLYSRDAVAKDDPVGRPAHFDWTEDYIWSLILLSAPAHISISCGLSNLSADLPAGANKVRLDLTPKKLASLGEKFEQCQVTALVQRDGKDIVNYVPSGFIWRKGEDMGRYNFNAFVAASP